MSASMCGRLPDELCFSLWFMGLIAVGTEATSSRKDLVPAYDGWWPPRSSSLHLLA